MAQVILNPQHDQFVEEHAEQIQQIREAIEQVLPQERYFPIEHVAGMYWQHHQWGERADIFVSNPRLDRVTFNINDQNESLLSFRLSVVTDNYYEMRCGMGKMYIVHLMFEQLGAREIKSVNDDRPFLTWELLVGPDQITNVVSRVFTLVEQVNT